LPSQSFIKVSSSSLKKPESTGFSLQMLVVEMRTLQTLLYNGFKFKPTPEGRQKENKP